LKVLNTSTFRRKGWNATNDWRNDFGCAREETYVAVLLLFEGKQEKATRVRRYETKRLPKFGKKKV